MNVRKLCLMMKKLHSTERVEYEYKFEEVKPLENQGMNGNFVTKEEFQQWQQGIDNQFKRLFGYLQNGGIKNESGNNAGVKQPSNVATKVE